MDAIHHRSCFIPQQQGVALIMAMVFLLLLTLIGVTAMNTTSLEEKMAGNMTDKTRSFQAAESALITAENWIKGLISKPVFPTNGIGLYTTATGATPVWDSLDWSGTANLVVYPDTPAGPASGGLNLVKTQPKYIIEDMGEVPEVGGSISLSSSYKGKGNTVVRITAYGSGATDAATTLLQTTYSRPF